MGRGKEVIRSLLRALGFIASNVIPMACAMSADPDALSG
jgi:hypothetical protein